MGATLVPLSVPHMTLALPAYYVLACAEASSNFARYGGSWLGEGPREDTEPASRADWQRLAERRDPSGNEYSLRDRTRTWGFGAEVRKRLLAGTRSLTAGAFDNSYLKALEVRDGLRHDYSRVFRIPHVYSATEPAAADHGVDLIIHPTALGPAPALDQITNPIDGYAGDILTAPASMAGLPCLSVPIHTDAEDGRREALGISLTSQWGMDGLLFDVGRCIGSEDQ